MLDPFVAVANLFGASADQVKLIFCLLVTYPLGSLFIRIPPTRPNVKHLFNIVISVIFFFPLLRLPVAFFQLLASMLATFFLTKYVHGSKMPWVVFAVVMAHLTVNHVIRSMNNFSYETLEVTSPQMVLVMKLTTFAWNVYDGRRPEADLGDDKWQLTKRIVKFPTLLEFLGYSFYFPGMLVGPYLDFNGYMDLVNETIFKSLAVKGKGGRNMPDGRKRVAYRKMTIGLMYLGVFVVFGPNWSFQLTKTLWFKEQPLYIRIALHQVCGTTERMKYYAIWILTEGASIVTGLGFSGIGPSGETLWEGAKNVTPLEVELPSNWKTCLDHWNTKTTIWLRETVYKRITPKGKKPGFSSSMLTFFTSAFWHGTAGGYYLSFLTGGFITTIGRLARANFRPLVLPAPGSPPTIAKRLYDVVGTFVTVLLLNYTVAPFMLLTAESSIATWTWLWFYGHAMIAVALVFFYAGGAKACKRLQKKQAGKLKKNDDAVTPADEKVLLVPPPLDSIVPPS
ncbi:endoplasmic reticulum protein [Mycena amicta]|nr:endoplasmic reticulum protein [Mycena amicta]